MASNKPWKVVLTPTELGVVLGKCIEGRVLEEYDDIVVAYSRACIEYKKAVESGDLKYRTIRVFHYVGE